MLECKRRRRACGGEIGGICYRKLVKSIAGAARNIPNTPLNPFLLSFCVAHHALSLKLLRVGDVLGLQRTTTAQEHFTSIGLFTEGYRVYASQFQCARDHKAAAGSVSKRCSQHARTLAPLRLYQINTNIRLICYVGCVTMLAQVCTEICRSAEKARGVILCSTLCLMPLP